MIVLDAGVAAKLLVAEPGSADAARLVARYPLLLAPEIIAVEVAAAVTHKAREGEIDRPTAERVLVSWWEFLSLGNLRLTPDRALLPEAAKLAVALARRPAECLYVALAASHAVPLITADASLRDAVPAAVADVCLLTEFAAGAA